MVGSIDNAQMNMSMRRMGGWIAVAALFGPLSCWRRGT
jgi:hypothetical protein